MIFPSASHIYNCMNVRSEGGQGTAFIYGTGAKTFFLTARHVLGGSAPDGFIYLKKDGDWAAYMLTMVEHHAGGQDLSAFAIKGLKTKVDYAFSSPQDPKVYPGQEVKFTGFPHGLENTIISPNGFSTPLVRTAFLSGLIVQGSGLNLLILDGLNNPGYSGGPIWAPGPSVENPSLLGVVSGYRVELKSKSRVYKDRGDGTEETLPNIFIKPNSGMIHAIPYADVISLSSSIKVYNCK